MKLNQRGLGGGGVGVNVNCQPCRLDPPSTAAAGPYRLSRVLFCLGHVSCIPDFYQQPPVSLGDSHLDRVLYHLVDKDRRCPPYRAHWWMASASRGVKHHDTYFQTDGHEVIFFSFAPQNLYCFGSSDCLNVSRNSHNYFRCVPFPFQLHHYPRHE